MVTVNLSITGLNISVAPEDTPQFLPSASDKTTSEASVSRIAISIFDANTDTLVKSITETSSSSDFGQDKTITLPTGSYKVVVVAHAVINDTDPVATITSPSAVSFGSVILANPTYTKVQQVTIVDATSQTVTIDMGTRRNASFALLFADANPSDVAKLQFIISPSDNPYTDLIIDPSSGLATQQWCYQRTWTFANLSKFKNTKGVTFTLPLALTATSQNLDIIINALSNSDVVLYTRTLEDVPLQQAHRTLATGNFFNTLTAPLTYDITEITDTISI